MARLLQEIYQTQQGGLSRAGGTYQPQDLSLFDTEVDALEDLSLAIAFSKISYLEKSHNLISPASG
jgi:hypothetical protein